MKFLYAHKGTIGFACFAIEWNQKRVTYFVMYVCLFFLVASVYELFPVLARKHVNILFEYLHTVI